MKKALKLSTLILACVLFVGLQSTDAQRRGEGKTQNKKEKDTDYFDESGGFAHRLWYGGMLNFQLQGSNTAGNLLLVGISPMVGYKLNDMFSIGPRAQLNYIVQYLPGPNDKFLQWGIGGFARAKVYNAIFAHAEYGFEALSYISGEDDQRLDSGTNFYFGGGYNSSVGSGGFGYEILILYNFLAEDNFEIPIEYRIGFTYNF